jgi:hypothetical protein
MESRKEGLSREERKEPNKEEEARLRGGARKRPRNATAEITTIATL